MTAEDQDARNWERLNRRGQWDQDLSVLCADSPNTSAGLLANRIESHIFGLERALQEQALALGELRALVLRQAEDEGLWFVARTAPEAYLQQELRRLHAAIEREPLTRSVSGAVGAETGPDEAQRLSQTTRDCAEEEA